MLRCAFREINRAAREKPCSLSLTLVSAPLRKVENKRQNENHYENGNNGGHGIPPSLSLLP